MQLELRFPAKKFVAFSLAIIFFLSTVVTAVATTIAATIVDDGKTYTIQVLSSETEDILQQASIKLGDHDIVTRSDEHGILINIRRGYEIDVTADGETTPVILYGSETTQQALQKAGVELDDGDIVNVPLSEELSDGATVSVTRQHDVHIMVDGGLVSTTVAAGTVEEALTQAGVSVGEDDIVSPSLNAPAGDGMIVTVKRVTYREVTAIEEIPYTTVTEESDSVSLGSFRVTTVGETGEREVTSREMLIDGIVHERETLESAILKQPVAEVKLVAPQPTPRSITAVKTSGGTLTDSDGNTISYSRMLKGKATAYTSNGGRTSTGRPAQVGNVAVDPKVIPYGSKLYIASPNGKVVYGYAVAADTGGAMRSGRVLVDLYYDTERECRNFGVRNMEIYILD